MSILLRKEEQEALRHRYLNDDLFRQWSFVLSHWERSFQEANPVSVWYVTDNLIQRLHDAGEHSDAVVPFLYTELLNTHGEMTAITVMTVLFTRLANTAESADASDDNPHKPLCIAILREINNKPLFEKLITEFEAQKLDNRGQNVFIQSTDPMDIEASKNSMDEIAKKENEALVKWVIQKTKGLKSILNQEHWDCWESIWIDICNDSELLLKLKEKNNPRGSDWAVNEKMVFNVLGIFLDIFEYKNTDIKANNAISSSNKRDYITNHGYKNGSSTVLKTMEIHDKVESIVKEYADC